MVSTAASLQAVMRLVQSEYIQDQPGISIVDNFGASGSLAQQIVQGAPADVFLSASPDWMDALDRQGLILENSRKNLLKNSLVLAVPKSDAVTTRFEDLKADRIRRVAIGEPESVPAGKYAKEALSRLGLFDGLQSKLVLGKDVRQVLAYVETGSVEAGLVYSTDALASDKVRVVATVPANVHSPILYPIAVVKASKNAAAALSFVSFLSTQTARKIFIASGFDFE